MDKEQSSNRQRAFLFLVLFIWYIFIFKHILPPPPTSHTHFEDTNLGGKLTYTALRGADAIKSLCQLLHFPKR